jgi:hypothetical protein
MVFVYGLVALLLLDGAFTVYIGGSGTGVTAAVCRPEV